MMPQPGMMLSADEVRLFLRLELRSGGAKAAFCRKHKVNPTALSNSLSGERPPSPRILKALGLAPMVVYLVKRSSSTRGASK